MLVTKTSELTGITRTLDLPITQLQLDLWENSNRLVQEVFPNLTDSQREFLLTGMIDEEWDSLFADEEI